MIFLLTLKHILIIPIIFIIGAETYSMDLHFPIKSEDEVIEKYDNFFEEHKNVKIAVLGRFHGFR